MIFEYELSLYNNKENVIMLFVFYLGLIANLHSVELILY